MAKSFGPGEAPRVVNGAGWTMLVIATIFLVLRLYSRLSRSKSLWWDDYILIISTALLVISVSFLTKAMSIGYLDYDPASLEVVMFWRISQTHQIVSLALAKTSFGLTLLRLSNKWQKALLWFLIGSANLLFAVHVFALWIGPCDHSLPYHHVPGICWSPTNTIIMNITAAMYSTLTDFVMAVLPWKVILNLNMKKSEKISVGIAMSVGVIAAVTGLMKGIQSIITIDYTKPSFAYDIVHFWIFMMAEPNATIIAASAPSLRGLIQDFRNKSSDRYNSPQVAGYVRSVSGRMKGRSKQGRSDITVTGHEPNDSGSDRSILGHQGHNKNERTAEIRIDYELHGGGSASDAYEMLPRGGQSRHPE